MLNNVEMMLKVQRVTINATRQGRGVVETSMQERVRSLAEAQASSNCKVRNMGRLTCLAERRVSAHLQFCAARHHLLKPNAHALDDGKQHGATDGAVSSGLEAAPNGERASRHESRADGIPRVLLPSHTLDGAVECAEETAPDAKVAS